MSKKILVTYASKAGSTQEVAEVVADELLKNNFDVDTLSVNNVKDLRSYAGVVFGTAIRMSKPVGAANKFVKKFRGQMSSIPVAIFSVGLAMKEDTPENRKEAERFLTPITEVVKPVNLALFGGKLDYSTLSPFFRFAFSRDNSGQMAEGDWRDWESIREWATNLAAYFE